MHILYFFIFIAVSNYTFAAANPSSRGQCNFSSSSLTYSGLDITAGPLTNGSEKLLGQLDFFTNYSCWTYSTATDGYSVQWGIDSSGSHIAGTRFKSNIDGIELRLIEGGNSQTMQLSRIAGQTGTGIVLTRWVTSNINVNSRHSNSWNDPMFAVYQTGTISSMSTKTRLGLNRDYNIITFKGANTSEGIYNPGVVFPKSQELQLLDPTCKLNYQPKYDIGDLIQGREREVDFNISLACTHAKTIQNNFEWQFNVSGPNISTSSDKSSAIYSGSGLPSVIMNINNLRNDNSAGPIVFGKDYLFLNPSNNNTFNFPLRAKFSAGKTSNTGVFSFNLNFQLNYN